MQQNNNKIAIVGLGFCGNIFLHQLVNMLEKPIEIDVFDGKSLCGKGIAYSTSDFQHLLNVPAGKMTALYGQDGDFVNWLKSRGYEYQGSDFVPRRVYGLYLEEIFQKTLELAKNKNIKINLIKQIISPSFVDNQEYRHYIIATGLGFKSYGDILNVWLSKIRWDDFNDKEVWVIGAGLTTYDVLISLFKFSKPLGAMVVSRSNLFPNYHQASKINYDSGYFVSKVRGEVGLLGILSLVRKECKKMGKDWQVVLDSLRPFHQEIWQKFSPKDKQRFLSKLLTFWNVHRHRAPFQTYQIIQDLIHQSKISFVKCNINDIDLSGKSVINCLGFDLRNNDFFQFKNHPHVTLLGGLNVNDYFEITAVPELRKHVFDKAFEFANRFNKKIDNL